MPGDGLRERRVLLQVSRDERKRRPGRGRREIGGQSLHIGRLPCLDAFDEDEAGTAAEQAHRVARRDRILARQRLGVM